VAGKFHCTAGAHEGASGLFLIFDFVRKYNICISHQNPIPGYILRSSYIFLHECFCSYKTHEFPMKIEPILAVGVEIS